MNRLAQNFISQFEKGDNCTNPFAIGMKMIIASLNLCDDNPSLDLKKILSGMYIYLCCSNIIIFDHNMDILYIYNDEYPEVVEFTKEFIVSQIDNFENEDGDVNHYVSCNRFHLDCFNVKTESNTNYYVALVNNSLADKRDSEELILIAKGTLYVIFSLYENTLKIKRLSEKDDLTGLFAHRLYQKEMENLNSQKRDITFILCDLFRLKYVNDKFGHQNGNLYIVTASQLLSKHFPNCVYRIGGDEFAIIVPKTKNIDKIFKSINSTLAEILHSSISKETHFIINHGCVSGDTATIPANTFFNLADEKLSKNKSKTYKELNIDRRSNSQ